MTLTDLQRQVAERIMGWTACRMKDGRLYGHPPDSTGKEEELRLVPDYPRSMDACYRRREIVGDQPI